MTEEITEDKTIVLPTHNRASLYKKMAKVMGLIERVPKNGYNSFHKYPYATDADVADTIRNALSEAGVAFTIEMLEYDRLGSNRTLIKFRFTFADSDTGAEWSGIWWSEAEDKQDKGIAKAATAAVKYLLLKNFVVSTGDKLEDSDSGIDETSPPTSKENKPQSLQVKSESKDSSNAKNLPSTNTSFVPKEHSLWSTIHSICTPISAKSGLDEEQVRKDAVRAVTNGRTSSIKEIANEEEMNTLLDFLRSTLDELRKSGAKK